MTLIFAGCASEKVDAVLVHSLQASHQTTLFHANKKILVTQKALATSAVNNPVKLGDVLFVSYALDGNVTVAEEEITVVSKNAHIEIIPTPRLINPRSYNSENIDKELQSIGCAPSKEHPNTAYEALPPLAQKLMRNHYVLALKIGDFESDTAPFFIAFKVGDETYKVRYLLKKIQIEE